MGGRLHQNNGDSVAGDYSPRIPAFFTVLGAKGTSAAAAVVGWESDRRNASLTKVPPQYEGGSTVTEPDSSTFNSVEV